MSHIVGTYIAKESTVERHQQEFEGTEQNCKFCITYLYKIIVTVFVR